MTSTPFIHQSFATPFSFGVVREGPASEQGVPI